jgi:hypothetical protein
MTNGPADPAASNVEIARQENTHVQNDIRPQFRLKMGFIRAGTRSERGAARQIASFGTLGTTVMFKLLTPAAV